MTTLADPITPLLGVIPLSGAEHYPLDTMGIFAAIFVFSMIVDLLQHRADKDMTVRGAASWTIFWIGISLAFAGWIYFRHGGAWASMFLTGYVLEQTLSIDNLIVFIAIFKFFNIQSGLQRRILYYGILGAIIFRFIFVAIGTGFLVWAGPWAEVVFGVFVAWAGVQMLRGDKEHQGEPDYENMGLVRYFRRLYPVFPRLVGGRFFIDRATAEEVAKTDPSITLASGVTRWMTPAFVCLLVIEGSDLLFAFDSVPAVIAVTKEPVLVYTAMIFAVLGLRSMYFILLVLTRYLVHLEKAIIYVLFFVALKMFMGASHGLLGWPHWEITPNMSMAIVLSMLGMGVLASFIWPPKEEAG